MRDYEAMRIILVKTLHADKELSFIDYVGYDTETHKAFQEEFIRLKKEGLIKHNMEWGVCFNGGTVKGLTTAGEDFARHIQDDSVWFVVLKTLKKSKLDISYPLIQKVCERVAERIVMNCLPDEFK